MYVVRKMALQFPVTHTSEVIIQKSSYADPAPKGQQCFLSVKYICGGNLPRPETLANHAFSVVGARAPQPK
jgi:hypothetical protein